MKITATPGPALVAEHAALESGVHGATGVIATRSDTETLTNKTIGAGGLTIENVGTGGNSVLSSNSSAVVARLSGHLQLANDLYFLSATAFTGAFEHAISANRTWTLPDVTGNVIIDADTGKSLSLAQLTIENAGAGGDPVISCNSATDLLQIAGKLYATNYITTAQDLKFQSSTAFSAVLSHTITAARTWTFPDVAGTVCMWNASNSAKTRYYHVKIPVATTGALDISSADCIVTLDFGEVAVYNLDLPDGCTVTDIYITTSGGGDADDMQTSLQEYTQPSTYSEKVAVTSSDLEDAETKQSIAVTDFVVDTSKDYFMRVASTSGTFAIHGVSVKYTQTQP